MDKFESQMRKAITGEIRAELAYQRLSQQELSERINLTPAVLNRYMRGHRDMRLGTYFKICDALKVSPDSLMTRAVTRTQ